MNEIDAQVYQFCKVIKSRNLAKLQVNKRPKSAEREFPTLTNVSVCGCIVRYDTILYCAYSKLTLNI